MSTNKTNPKLFGQATNAATDNVDLLATPIFKDEFWDVPDSVKLLPNWSGLFPFQFIFIERVNGKWQRPTKKDMAQTFTLPMPPSSLVMDIPFAITTNVTMGGIVEEHNGSPLRDIVIQGSTGVLPLRGNSGVAEKLSAFAGVFAGTVNTANSLVKQASTIANLRGATADGTLPNVISTTNAESDNVARGSGFHQYTLLVRFLEGYVNLKKTPAGKNIALAFAIWKENAVYIVTPQRVTIQRSAASPLEYNYSIPMKAWRRIVLDGTISGEELANEPVARNPNAFAAVLNTMEGAQRVLQNSKAVLQAVRADIDIAVFNPLRKAVLFVKEAIGVGTTAADLPVDIISDFREPVLEKIGLGDGVQTLLKPAQDTREKFMKLLDDLRDMSAERNKSTTQSAIQGRKDPLSTAPAASIFTDPSTPDAQEFFSALIVGNLNLRPETIKKIDSEKRAVRQLRREDFEESRDKVLELLAFFENSIGMGDATYNAIHQIPDTGQTRVATDDDMDVLYSLSELSTAYDSLAASQTINRNVVSSIDYIAGLANRSGIAFTVPTSKYLVPFPYDFTLEQLSARYLGTPDRWHEIAALNGLESPFVDEVGFFVNLITNGIDNQVTVSDGSKFFVGQAVWISSNTELREKRRVSGITTLSPTLVVLQLDGDSDLYRYTVAESANIQAFLPNTVNSLQFIYIPSDEQAEDDWRTKEIPGIDYFDPMVKIGGIDLLLTQSGDLAISPTGQTRLAVGLNNLIQRVKIAFGTPKGSLLGHPEFGFGIKIGSSIADVSAQTILQSAKSYFNNSKSFSGIDYASVRIFSNSATLTMGVGLVGIKKTVPITVQLVR